MPDNHLEHQACWVCASGDTMPWKSRNTDRPLEPADFHITDSRYGQTLALRRCNACGFIFAEGDELGRLESLYERLDDAEYENTLETRVHQMRWLLRRALRAKPDARSLLDVGAGAGLLVREARAMGLKADGVEPSHSLVAAAERANGVELHQGVFPHPAMAEQRFDIIALVDVIEHVSDPVALLTHCREALNDGGVLLVVTPDVQSIAARLLGQRWWHFRLAHVGYFNRRTLAGALAQAGCEPLHWTRARWYFPARYLAQRVERYLPVGWLNRMIDATALGRWAGQRLIPLDLHDSWFVTARGAALTAGLPDRANRLAA